MSFCCLLPSSFYLVLFSFGFKNLHETFEILETLCTQLSQLSHFSHTYFEPYYILIVSYFYAGYYLFPISACSFFDNLTVSTQPVPFLLYLFLFGLSLFPLSPACSFFHSPTLLKLSLLFYSLFLFSLQREQVYYFPPFTEDEFLLMFIAFVLQ